MLAMKAPKIHNKMQILRDFLANKHIINLHFNNNNNNSCKGKTRNNYKFIYILCLFGGLLRVFHLQH